MAIEKTTLHLPTMHCEGCLRTVRRELEEAGAMVESSDIATKRLVVQFESKQLTHDDVVAVLEAIGFPAADQA
ncbi:MAG: heavy-metal-associated domain-containing protein [Dehalococcoidia bacterium]